MDDRTGQQFGTYRLVRLLGRGAAYEVYLGEHARLKRYVAIKISQVSLESNSQRDFLNEALLLARLDHPNIEHVFDFGVANTTPYLVTEYAPDGTLRNRHPRGTPLSIALTVSYVKQIAGALQYLHDHNIIHRDVKPENMLVRASGEVLLSSPGITAFTSDSSLNSPTITARSVDRIGNATYMAPEQIQGAPVRASDQYSLAIVVYEWLTGKAPFRGTSSVDTIIKHLNEPPPSLRAINPGIPSDVEEVVMIALAKAPKRRFANVSAFATAFEQAVNLSPEEQESPSSKADPAALPSWSQPAPSPQSAPPAPGKAFEIDPGSQPLPSLPLESPYQQPASTSPGWGMPAQQQPQQQAAGWGSPAPAGQGFGAAPFESPDADRTILRPTGGNQPVPAWQQQPQQAPWGSSASAAGTPSPKETPLASPTPVTPDMPGQGSTYGQARTGALQTPPLASRRPSITAGLGDVLKRITFGRKDGRQQAKELSLFAIARTTVDDDNRAIVGQIYTIEAGIAQNRPEDFRGEPVRVRTHNATDPLLFDILIHPGDNVELMGALYQRLRYNPGSAEPQFIRCPFRLKAPGRGQLIVHFYRERQWLKAIHFEFEGILQPRPAATIGWR